MDFWDQDYFRASKITSCLVGQWPYQSVKELILYRGILSVLIIIMVIPRIRAVIIHNDDPDIVLDATGAFIIDILFMIKTLNNWYNFKKMKLLLDQVKENLKIFSEDELRILHQWSESGRRLSIIYSGAVIGGAAVSVTEPLQLQLVHIFLKTNETLQLFPVPVDYGPIDVEKYYWGLLLLTEFTLFLLVIGLTSCDLLFFIYSYHIFGLFATLGYIIERLPIDDDDNDRGSNHVKRCIQIHHRATEFVEKLADIYIWSFFSVVGLNMMIISITFVQIVVKLDAKEKILQYGSLTVAVLGHIFVECLMGQRLIDHSMGIQEHVLNTQWYYSSVKSQKMMSLLLMRSQLPCQLTAGKFVIMNFETFSKIIKTSGSYFTLLLATR